MGFPMTAGGVIPNARAARAPAKPPKQIRRHATFVEEDIVADVTERLPGPPLPTRRGDIRSTLFVGVYRFF
jgi:hypothetical protein